MGGETLRLGRRTPKGVTGYDLTALFVGSEGTFGVITELTLRLVGRPEGVGTFIAVMPDAVSAGRAVSEIIRKGHRPRALELLDRASIDHVRPKAAYAFPADAGAIVLVELDGEPDGIESAVLRCAAVCEAEGARDVIVARDDADRERLWKTRRVSLAGAARGVQVQASEDIVVPRSSIPEMLARVDAIGARHKLETATFGHAGDGNLHVNSCRRRPRATPRSPRASTRRWPSCSATLDLGGTLSGEHGIGIAKARYMAWEQSAEVIDWQKRLKRMWDPANLLNPGKIFVDLAAGRPAARLALLHVDAVFFLHAFDLRQALRLDVAAHLRAVVVQRFVQHARVALALQPGRVLLAEVVAHALARVALAVEHPHDQRDQPRHHRAQQQRAQEAEALAVLVNVDVVGLAADRFELFGRLVHLVGPWPML